MRTQSGFSLLELVSTICILSIAGLFAAPELLRFRSTLHLNDEVMHLVHNLQFSKFEAILENTSLAVIFRSDGYSIFVDDGSGNGVAENYQRDGAERVVTQYTLPTDITLSHTSTLAKVRFRGVRGNACGSIFLTGNNGKKVRIVLSRIGRIRVEKVK